MEAAAAKTVQAEQSAKVPDAPPFVVKCLEAGARARGARQAKAGGKTTADDLVAGELLTAAEKQKCGKALLDWYRTIQKANQQKVAAAK